MMAAKKKAKGKGKETVHVDPEKTSTSQAKEAKGKGKETVHADLEETSTSQATGDGQIPEVLPLLFILTVVACGGREPD